MAGSRRRAAPGRGGASAASRPGPRFRPLPAAVGVAAVAGAALAASGLLAEPGGRPADRVAAPPFDDPPAAAGPALAVAGAGEATAEGTRLTAVLAGALEGGRPPGLTIALADAATGDPVVGATRPQVWAGVRPDGAGEESCEQTVTRLRPGGPGAAAEVDLTGYQVVTLDESPTLSVLDPAVDVAGITRLLALPRLSGPGHDWALSRDGGRLVVTIPSTGRLAVVDTTEFRVTGEVEAGRSPRTVTVDPAGTRLWVTNDPGDGRTGGVTVLDAGELGVLARFSTAPGPLRAVLVGGGPLAGPGGHSDHAEQPASAEPSGTTRPASALVVHRDGTVVVVDGAALRQVPAARLDGTPTSAVAAGDRVWVGIDGGPVRGLDATGGSAGTVPGAEDVTALALTPDGGTVLALSTGRGLLTAFDARTGAVRATAALDGVPDQVVTAGGFAYVRDAERSALAVLPLADLVAGGEVTPVRVQVGEPVPAGPPAAAAAIAPVQGHGVLAAHAADRYVYLYMPGMNAPMGGFRTDSRVPRAVTAVDRAPRETAPGVFTASLPLPRAGEYDVAVVVESPRVAACFRATAEEAAGAVAAAERRPASLLRRGDPAPLRRGVPTRVVLDVADREGRPIADLADLQVVATHVAGAADARGLATPLPDGGYAVELALPVPGDYRLRVASPAGGLGLADLPPVALVAEAG